MLTVTQNALLMCSFGMAPSTLNVIPKPVIENGMPGANIMDFAPFVNIMPFGMCVTLSNPAVAAATSANFGVLTPQPCTPMTCAPWSPPGKTLLCGCPILLQTAMLNCMFGGVIMITMPGQFTIIAN